ncbi:MAG: poly(3-hydroxybutyrate) depolymerase [Micavibrio sp. TMED2]|nr:poly(3-hydroxybutyrate) depolymerase [Alphaproteobacteria bacterium]OUT41364.1 MAG: poly(3-hydroxybutyrate) depolymerase [Micavibrio sp. TMED2]
MLYQIYDMNQAALAPMRFAAELTQAAFQNPLFPLSYTRFGRTVAAGAEMFERTTRRFAKPEFGLHRTEIDGREVTVEEETIVEKPFCRLLRFKRDTKRNDPKLLVVAPMSGHHATLLRGTVEALLPHHDVYITDWIDARHVPLKDGKFNLDTYIDYVIDFVNELGPETHLMAVCQPAVPVLAAAAVMAENDMPNQPKSMTLMGGPIDTREAPTSVTKFAEQRPMSWFERNVIAIVPPYYGGGSRAVYPGFLQLSGFMSMNMDRHIGAHMNMFQHLGKGDGESAAAHRKFYDEYLSVMDMPAEFYLETVQRVFKEHALPRGALTHHGQPVNPAAIKKTALFTVEGELDDISAVGQTKAAHKLCRNIPENMRREHVQSAVGHYGIFNGRRWREQIMPRVRDFIRDNDIKRSPAPRFGSAGTKGDVVKLKQAS